MSVNPLLASTISIQRCSQSLPLRCVRLQRGSSSVRIRVLRSISRRSAFGSRLAHGWIDRSTCLRAEGEKCLSHCLWALLHEVPAARDIGGRSAALTVHSVEVPHDNRMCRRPIGAGMRNRSRVQIPRPPVFRGECAQFHDVKIGHPEKSRKTSCVLILINLGALLDRRKEDLYRGLSGHSIWTFSQEWVAIQFAGALLG